MKRYKLLYLVAGVASVLMTGCNDMENTPSNKFTDNSFWNSTEKAQYVVNMAYSQMYNAGRMWKKRIHSLILFPCNIYFFISSKSPFR